MTEEATNESKRHGPPPPPSEENSVDNGKGAPHWLTPLPWEEGKGFLWGFPKTVWLLLRHPFQSFERPDRSSTLKCLGFLCLLWGLVGFGWHISRPFFGEIFSGRTLPENIMSLWGATPLESVVKVGQGAVLAALDRFGWVLLQAIPVYCILHILKATVRPWKKALRIIIYCAVADVFLLIPVLGKTISLCLRIVICAGAFKSYSRVGLWHTLLLGAVVYATAFVLGSAFTYLGGMPHLISSLFYNWFWPL